MTKAPLPPARRSDHAKARILEAAREVFSEKGYEAATVRQIAERAAIHASMITRYFETKEQLFALASDIRLDLGDLSQLDRSAIGEHLARRFVTLWEGESAGGRLQALFRASVSKEDARRKVVQVFEQQVRTAIGDLDGAETRAGFVAAFLLGVAYARYIARLPPVAVMDAEALRAHVARTLQFILDGAGED